MKKIFYSILIAGLALASASCQKVEEKTGNPDKTDGQSTSPALTVTATIADIDGTKVSYGFTGTDKDKNPLPEKDKAKSCIKQEWEMGDQIIVRLLQNGEFTATSYTFSVNAVKDGVASFSVGGYEPTEGDILYAVYYPGKTVNDITPDKIISFDNQTGKLGENVPAILCAGADVTQKDGNYSVKFDFTNQTAIVGIYKMQILDNDTPASNIKITKVILKNVPTSGQFKYYNNNTCEFLAVEDGKLGDIICDDLKLFTNEGGYIEVDPDKPETFIPYFSVIPGNSEISVSVSDDNGKIYRNQTVIPAKALAAGTYYYLGKTMSTTVAKKGETSYTSLANAIADVSGSEPTKIDLVSETEETCTIPTGKNITLNLAGRKIKGCITVSGELTVNDEIGTGKIVNDNTCLNVMSNGKLTINGGTVEANSSDNDNGATVVINKSGSTKDIEGTVVTFNGGKISQIGSSTRGAIDAKYSTIKFLQSSQTEVSTVERSFVCGTGVKLEINDGTFKSSKSYTIFLNSGADNSVLINGGTFTASSNCFQLYGTKTNVNVMGGSFKWDEHKDFLSLAYNAEPSQLKISGGEYSDCILADILSSNYGIQKKLGDYKYEVISPENGCEAEYTSNNNKYRYVSVTDALQDASGISTVKLLKDCTNKTEKLLGASQQLTLDLNEHVLTIQGKMRITPNDADATLTIQGNGTMKNSSSGSNLFNFSTGSVILEEGTLTRLENTEGTSAIVSISGGSFEMKKDTELNDGGCAINARPLSISGTAKVTISGSVSTNADNSREAVYITGGELTIDGNITAGGTALGVGGSDKVTCTISGGAIVAEKIDAVAVNINNSNANTEVTINGKTVSIDTPNREKKNKDIPVVELKQGKLSLIAGTVGVPTSASSDISGAFTAVRVGDGCFEMTGGTLKAKRHALILNGSGRVDIEPVDIESECDVQNISSGASYYLIRFDNGSTNTLTISNGYFYALSSSPVFNTIPVGSTLSISGGYFNKGLEVDVAEGYTVETLNPAEEHSGKEYKYKVVSTTN